MCTYCHVLSTDFRSTAEYSAGYKLRSLVSHETPAYAQVSLPPK